MAKTKQTAHKTDATGRLTQVTFNESDSTIDKPATSQPSQDQPDTDQPDINPTQSQATKTPGDAPVDLEATVP